MFNGFGDMGRGHFPPPPPPPPGSRYSKKATGHPSWVELCFLSRRSKWDSVWFQKISISLDGASLEIPGGGGTEAQISKGYGSKKSSVFPEGPFASML